MDNDQQAPNNVTPVSGQDITPGSQPAAPVAPVSTNNTVSSQTPQPVHGNQIGHVDRNRMIELICLAWLLLLIILVVAVYSWQHGKVNRLEKQIKLDQQSQLRPSGYGYGRDGSPSEINQALEYGAQPSDATVTIPNGQLTVKSAFYATHFGGSSMTDNGAVIDLVIKNQTTTQQTYDLSQIGVQLPSGQIINMGAIYDSASTDENITVAASGVVTVYLEFSNVGSSNSAGNGSLIYSPQGSAQTYKIPLQLRSPLNS